MCNSGAPYPCACERLCELETLLDWTLLNFLQGVYLSPLDYCTEENTELAELLKSFGALSGEAVVEQRKAAADKEETDLGEASEMAAAEQQEDAREGGIYMCV